jgi:hypothetical protein
MPFLTGSTRMTRGLFATALAAGLLAAPAADAKATAANAQSCTPQPATATPFKAFGDPNLYTLIAGGDMESAMRGWTLSGGATVVEGNAPFGVGKPGDHRSLALPGGSKALTATICIDPTYPWARMSARKRAAGGALSADVVYTDTKGRLVTKDAGSYNAPVGVWTLTDPFPIRAKLDESVAGGAAPIALLLSVPAGTAWQVDDVYVDPRMRS